jgi:hypothetical protein
MPLAVTVLSCLLASLIWCLVTRSTASSWCLLGLSALWLPTNNGHLEGGTLFEISATHGVTYADLLALGCWLVATATLVWRARRFRSPSREVRTAGLLLACAGVLALGALVTVASG